MREANNKNKIKNPIEKEESYSGRFIEPQTKIQRNKRARDGNNIKH